eukprot:1153303-Pelagomonas_calceolata.AAC.6
MHACDNPPSKLTSVRCSRGFGSGASMPNQSSGVQTPRCCMHACDNPPSKLTSVKCSLGFGSGASSHVMTGCLLG